MRRSTLAFLTALLLAVGAATGCARTVYTNLQPGVPLAPAAPDADRSPPRYWQHFYVWGWFPNVMLVDAAAYCGGADRIVRIETQRSFVQGLVASLAGWYVNVYSPYTGRVVCVHHES